MANITYVADVIPAWYVGLLCLLLYPVGLLAVLANSCILIATIKSRLLLDNTGLIIGSMAVHDLLLGIFAIEFSISMWIPVNSTYCKIQMALNVSMILTSLVHIVFLNLDRYVYIVHPFLYLRFFTRFKIIACLVSIWILPVVSSVANAMPGHRSISCFYVASNAKMSLLISTTEFLIPVIFMIFLFYRLYRAVCRQAISIEEQIKSVHSSVISHVKQSEKKAIKMIAIIMAVFLACFLPYPVVPIICISLNYDIESLLNYVVPWLNAFFFLSSCLNPIVYVKYNPRYRKAVIKLLQIRNLFSSVEPYS